MRKTFLAVAAATTLATPGIAFACDLDGIYGHRYNPLAKLFGEVDVYDDSIDARIAANMAAPAEASAAADQPPAPTRAAPRFASAKIDMTADNPTAR